MGWLFMRSLGGHAGPRAYLDAQFAYENERARSRVLRSALVRMRIWYAAVELVRPESGDRVVFAAVCLVRWNPRAREGYIFGYKDMDESLGPCEAECPAAILDLLTPTSKPYAVSWRERCRAHLARRRELCTVQKPRPGQTIVFEEPIRFADGRVLDRLLVVADPYGRSACASATRRAAEPCTASDGSVTGCFTWSILRPTRANSAQADQHLAGILGGIPVER